MKRVASSWVKVMDFRNDAQVAITKLQLQKSNRILNKNKTRCDNSGFGVLNNSITAILAQNPSNDKEENKLSRQAIGRQTDAASVLERFLDDETDNLSSNLFDGLEVVAESIDEMVNEMLGELQDVQEELETVKNEKVELESQIQELEEA